MNNNNSEALHKRTHWRHLRSIMSNYCKLEDVDVSKYDFNHICCYSCTGTELQGSNVTYTNVKDHCTPWVFDNHYDVYEVPAVTNYTTYRTNFVGSYLTFSHDKDFDYWVVGEFVYTVDPEKTKSYSLLADTAKYTIYGKYDITVKENYNTITKTELGKDCNFGGNSFEGRFDRVGSRRIAYGDSAKKYIDEIKGVTHNINDVSDTRSVQIYHRKKKAK